MKKKSVYLILLQGLYLAVATFGIKSLAVTAQEAITLNQAIEEKEVWDKHRNTMVEKPKDASSVREINRVSSEKLSPGKVWVLGEKKQVQSEPLLG